MTRFNEEPLNRLLERLEELPHGAFADPLSKMNWMVFARVFGRGHSLERQAMASRRRMVYLTQFFSNPEPGPGTEFSIAGQTYAFARWLGEGTYGRVALFERMLSAGVELDPTMPDQLVLKVMRGVEWEKLAVRIEQETATHAGGTILSEVSTWALATAAGGSVPFIARFMGIVTTSTGRMGFVSQYAPDGTLGDKLESFRDPALAELIMTQVALALFCMRLEHGITHGDLKPANVLLHGTTAYVTDFGMSSLVPLVGLPVGGTPDYMAPEILRAAGWAVGGPAGRPLAGEHSATVPVAGDAEQRKRAAGEGVAQSGELADVFAWGAMFYRLLSGKFPREVWGESREGSGFSGQPLQFPGNVPESLARVVEKAVAPDPAERWQSFSEILEELPVLWRDRIRPIQGGQAGLSAEQMVVLAGERSGVRRYASLTEEKIGFDMVLIRPSSYLRLASALILMENCAAVEKVAEHAFSSHESNWPSPLFFAAHPEWPFVLAKAWSRCSGARLAEFPLRCPSASRDEAVGPMHLSLLRFYEAVETGTAAGLRPHVEKWLPAELTPDMDSMKRWHALCCAATQVIALAIRSADAEAAILARCLVESLQEAHQSFTDQLSSHTMGAILENSRLSAGEDMRTLDVWAATTRKWGELLERLLALTEETEYFERMLRGEGVHQTGWDGKFLAMDLPIDVDTLVGLTLHHLWVSTRQGCDDPAGIYVRRASNHKNALVTFGGMADMGIRCIVTVLWAYAYHGLLMGEESIRHSLRQQAAEIAARAPRVLDVALAMFPVERIVP